MTMTNDVSSLLQPHKLANIDRSISTLWHKQQLQHQLQQLFNSAPSSPVIASSVPSPTVTCSSISTPNTPNRPIDLNVLFPELLHSDYEPISFLGGGAYGQVWYVIARSPTTLLH
jgi:hypothetical protein